MPDADEVGHDVGIIAHRGYFLFADSAGWLGLWVHRSRLPTSFELEAWRKSGRCTGFIGIECLKILHLLIRQILHSNIMTKSEFMAGLIHWIQSIEIATDLLWVNAMFTDLFHLQTVVIPFLVSPASPLSWWRPRENSTASSASWWRRTQPTAAPSRTSSDDSGGGSGRHIYLKGWRATTNKPVSWEPKDVWVCDLYSILVATDVPWSKDGILLITSMIQNVSARQPLSAVQMFLQLMKALKAKLSVVLFILWCYKKLKNYSH